MTRTPRAALLRLAATAATLALAAGTTAGCSSSDAASSDGLEITTIRYQGSAGAVDPLLVADALGELSGITLKRVGDVTGGPQSLQALVSNQTDISSSAFYGAIAQLVASGAPIKAVFPSYGSNDKTHGQIVVADDSSIRTPRDLIGKKIAVNTLGANAEAIIDTWLQKEGLSDSEIEKVTLVVLPPLNTPDALAKGQVDAAYLGVKGVEITNKAVATRTLVTDVDVVGPYEGGAISLREETIEKAPNTAKKLVTGLARAVEFIETHTPDEIYATLFPYLEENGLGDYEDAIRANYPGSLGLAPRPVISEASISRWTDWLVGRGDLPADKVKPSSVYTNELNPNDEAAEDPTTGGAS